MNGSAQELEMGRRCYGYGRWDAPYWFIGPEQGKGPEEAEGNALRLSAWLQLGACELSDCREFHRLIGEGSWHQDEPKFQKTWRPLILLLMAYLERDKSIESLRTYQRDRWGRISGGETCIIELSGLAARSLGVPTDRNRFLQERIEVIRQRMDKYKPDLVIMYGDSRERRVHWEEIAGDVFPSSKALPKLLKRGHTVIALVPHPIRSRLTDLEWTGLGEGLRNKMLTAAQYEI